MKPRELVSLLPRPLPSDPSDAVTALHGALVQILQKMDESGARNVRGNILLGTGDLATDQQHGFVYMPRFQGTPEGTPTDYSAGSPYGYDEKNDIFYVYNFAKGEWVAVGDEEMEFVLWLEILRQLENIFEVL